VGQVGEDVEQDLVWQFLDRLDKKKSTKIQIIRLFSFV
jgi:hypothetical protein